MTADATRAPSDAHDALCRALAEVDGGDPEEFRVGAAELLDSLDGMGFALYRKHHGADCCPHEALIWEQGYLNGLEQRG